LKKIAPIIVILVVCIGIFAWSAAAFIISFFTEGGSLIGLLLLIPGLCVIAALIVTLVTRIKEIDKEEKDDLSKY